MDAETTLPAASPAVRAAMRIALRNGCALSRDAAEQIAEAILALRDDPAPAPVCPKCGTSGCLEDKALDW